MEIFHIYLKNLDLPPGMLNSGTTIPRIVGNLAIGSFSTSSLNSSLYMSAALFRLVTIDSLSLARLDFMKIDVEGMEEDVLEGARDAISKFKPIMIIEIIKSNKDNLLSFLEPMGYFIYPLGINLLAIHKEDPINSSIKIDSNGIKLD